MSEILKNWLTEYGLSSQYMQLVSAVIGTTLLLLISWLSFYVARYVVLNIVHKIVNRSNNTFDDLMIEHKVFSRLSWLVPMVLVLALMPIFISENPILITVFTMLAKVALSLQVARSLSAFLNVTNAAFQETSKERYLPLNATIQLLKLAIYIVASIMAISILIDRSPIYLLSGLGALTAVLFLVFQDTIKGLVASIQISANKMVAPGDWISMPQYGADGDVVEIALNTVKIQNFDNTLTTIPTYALISESFKNWRGMSSSGGRRIKRSLSIDLASIHFCDAELQAKLQKIDLLKDYLNEKSAEIIAENKQKGMSNDDDVNSRKLTNIGTFRAYITAYLHDHPKVHQTMTCMVRQLEPTDKGVALELYFFSNDINWVNYETIQADIFDHLLSIAPQFELRIFQTPSGYDWQNRQA
ncbi:mechanosensitive ion channel family protein [Colwelliaceae bacterium BS250]